MAFVKILARPKTAIARRINSGFLICDLLGDLFPGQMGDGPGITPESISANNPTISTDWLAVPMLNGINNLQFIQFAPDGTVSLGTGPRIPKARAGIYIAPREAALDLRIGNNAEVVDGQNFDQHWEAERGTWNTVAAQSSVGGTAIFNSGSDTTAIARSAGTVPANRCFRVDLETYGSSRDGQPGIRFEWGAGTWSFVIRHNQSATIERKLMGAGGATGWAKVKTLSEFAAGNLLGGRYRIYVLRLDGRLVFLMQGKDGALQGVWLLNQEKPQDSPALEEQIQDVAWPAGRWRLTAFHCRVRCEVALIKWANPNGSPLSGTLGRKVKRKTLPNGEGIGTAGGWRREGTQARVEVSADIGIAQYQLALLANDDGISTPFVDRATVRYVPVWTNPVQDAMDLRPACTSLSVSLGMPPQMSGDEARIELSRDLLDRKVPGWESVTAGWCPVEIQVLRTGSGYSTIFSGYVFKPGKTSRNPGARSLSIVARDDIIRISKIGEANHAPIDHRYPPLDIIFAEKLTNTSGGYNVDGSPATPDVYGGECVQAILRIALGDNMADSINGNGNPRRYIASDHPALISAAMDRCGYMQLEQALGGQALTQSGWMFPPPFGDCALDWINKIAQIDRCVFFFRGGIPYYGRYYNLIAGSVVREVHDSDVGGGLATVLTAASIEGRPERDINRVLVWGPENQGIEGLLPALRMAEFKLPDSDPRSALQSWERTYIQREPLATLAAEAIGNGILSQLTGVRIEQPSFTQRGDERWKPGDIIHPILDGPQADGSLGLDDYYRVEKVDHEFTFGEGAENFATTLTPRPLTTQERALLP